MVEGLGGPSARPPTQHVGCEGMQAECMQGPEVGTSWVCFREGKRGAQQTSVEGARSFIFTQSGENPIFFDKHWVSLVHVQWKHFLCGFAWGPPSP